MREAKGQKAGKSHKEKPVTTCQDLGQDVPECHEKTMAHPVPSLCSPQFVPLPLTGLGDRQQSGRLRDQTTGGWDPVEPVG